MPRTTTDYSKMCIYKLVHKDDVDNENIYIGNTTNFTKRKNEHKSRIFKIGNQHYNQQKYVFIRDNGGWENWLMVEIEKYPCDDKREAETRERYWIEHYKSNLNRAIPTRSLNEWYKDNIETHSLNCKIYREANKEKIAEKVKEYYENNKTQINQKNKEYVQKNKEKTAEYQKHYREDNKEKIAEYHKEYYEDNKNKTLEKVKCECGKSVCKSYLSRHIKTVKHLQLLNSIA